MIYVAIAVASILIVGINAIVCYLLLRRKPEDGAGRIDEGHIEKIFENASNKTIREQFDLFNNVASSSIQSFIESQREQDNRSSTQFESLIRSLGEQTGKSVESSSRSLETLLNTFINQQREQGNKVNEEIRVINEALSGQRDLVKESVKEAFTSFRPQQIGSWGEVQVERIFEFSGFKLGINYEKQVTTKDGGRIDFLVDLSNERKIIVDSKVPLANAMLANEHRDDATQHEVYIEKHFKDLEKHVDTLASKEYWESVPDTIDIAVMVIPDMAMISAQGKYAQLLDYALQKRVVISSHSTLMAMLRSIAVTWQQSMIMDNRREISELTGEFSKRSATLEDYMSKTGNALKSATSSYNMMVKSYNTRIIPQRRKLDELRASMSPEIEEVKMIPEHIEEVKSVD